MYEVTYLTPCCIDSRALEYVVGGGAVVDWHIEGHVGVEDSGRLGRDVAGAGEVLRDVKGINFRCIFFFLILLFNTSCRYVSIELF